jgi:methyl-accepting chemotaxis protein
MKVVQDLVKRLKNVNVANVANVIELARTSIGTRLIIGFIFVSFITSIVGGIGIYNLNVLGVRGEQQYKENVIPMKLVADAGIQFQKVRKSYSDIVFNIGSPQALNYAMNTRRNIDILTETLQEYRQTLTSDTSREAEEFKALMASIESFEPILNNIMNLGTTNRLEEVKDILNGSAYFTIITDIDTRITTLYDLNVDEVKYITGVNSQRVRSSSFFMMLLVIGGTILAITLGVTISIMITRPIRKITSAANRLALGDVDVSIEVESKDEVGQLANAFRSMAGNIKEMAESAQKIAEGNLNTKINIRSPEDLLGIKLNEMTNTIQKLLFEVDTLTQRAVDGELNARLDISSYNGAWNGLGNGINNILDAVVEPIQEAKEVLGQMSRGNLGVLVKGDYKGDHGVIKNALNSTIKKIKSYMGKTIECLGEMAKGNLDVEITDNFEGDFVHFKQSINDIVISLNQVLTEINNASDQVASGARHVSDSAQSLSQGATEQASSVEEITASMIEIASQTKQNAGYANQANGLTTSAVDAAEDGNEKMKQMLGAMAEINEASINISKIIKLIDEIAFQTNILALNAAVEAARAGYHGRGFAVVAQEVKSLAARSAEAAKETEDIIQSSISKAEIGTKIAKDTAKALEKISKDVSSAASLVDQIASASNQQATSISYINGSIDEVSKVTQMTTSTAEESAAASEELASQAQVLKKKVNTFKIKETNKGKSRLQIIEEYDNYQPLSEAAVAKEHTIISLDDSEFGKY